MTPAVLLPCGTRVEHINVPGLTGMIVGYGTASYQNLSKPQPVYIVQVDEPQELSRPGLTYASICMICMNTNLVVEVKS